MKGGGDYTSSSEEDSDLATDLAVVAASSLSLDPFESGDQEEYMEVRVALNWCSRWEELFKLWTEAIANRFPDDEEKQARLTLALKREVENWQSASQERLKEKKRTKG